jgi:DNA-binding NarL/FixJ family response regulator
MANEAQDISALRKVLTALLLIQLREIPEADQVPLLIRSGWSNAEIAVAFGITENAVAIKRTRLKKAEK